MSFLDKIVKGKQERPARILIHGDHGVGKSSFAAGAPDPLFIDLENRTHHLDVRRFPVPTTWEEVLEMMAESVGNCSTLVIDGLAKLEQLLLDYITREAQRTEQHPPATYMDIGGGWYKFRAPMIQQWTRFVKATDVLQTEGVRVIMLGHSNIREFKNPTDVNFDRYELDLDPKGAAFLCREVDLVGFARFEDVVTSKRKTPSGEIKGQGQTTGSRVVTFAHDPCFDSKQGVASPDECSLTWSEFADAMQELNNK